MASDNAIRGRTRAANAPRRTGTLALVLGDQLTAGNPALANLDPSHDAILFVEAPEEAEHVWSHKARIASDRVRARLDAL